MNVFALDQWSAFAVLQSRVHEIWARFFASSLEERLRYTPTDCFETFPFPEEWRTSEKLRDAGKDYYEFRGDLMVRNGEGLTDTYNRFHDPEEQDADILKLRDLHNEIDRAVLDAYRWEDIRPRSEFLLDFEADEDTEPGKVSRRRKPWRYRWSDEIRDEVLARLLVSNERRAREETLAGDTAAAAERSALGSNKAQKRAKTKRVAPVPLLDNN